jgi:Flp pilus assembly protein TadB
MGDQPPEQPPSKSGYRSKWRRYLLIYLAVAVVAYGVIWYLFFRGGGGYF